MGFVSRLDELGQPERSPAERMRKALALFEEGLEMKRGSLRRRFPTASEAELQQELQRWLEHRDEA